MKQDTLDKYHYPLPVLVYKTLAKLLYSPLLFGENCVVLCPPLYGRDHAVNYVRERVVDRKAILGDREKRFHFLYIDLPHPKEDEETIWLRCLARELNLPISKTYTFNDWKSDLLSWLKKHNELVIFIDVPETLSDELFSRYLEFVQRVYYIAPSKIHILQILDMRWDEEQFFALTSPFRSLFQNVRQLPLYTDSEVAHLLHYFSRKWEYKFSQSVFSFITKQSGGILLLAKALLRVAIQEKKKNLGEIMPLIYHPDFLTQVKFFLSTMTQSQQKILIQIANHKAIDDLLELKHLASMKIVVNEEGVWKILSQALATYLEEDRESEHVLSKKIQQQTILSKREKKILQKLVTNQNQVVTRDQVAELLWRETAHEEYSDWGIDQAVSRLRKKMKVLTFLQGKTIVTQKKKGFLLR